MYDLIIGGLLSIVVAQFNPTVGKIEANIQHMISSIIYARDILYADIIVFPELSISGYHPQDFLLDPTFYDRIDLAVELLLSIPGIHIIVGTPKRYFIDAKEYKQNQALLIYNGEIKKYYTKHDLIDKFNLNEKKYFSSGSDPVVFECNKVNIGMLIGDDINNQQLIKKYKNQVDLLISLNAPVFHTQDTKNLVDSSKKISKQISKPVICSCLVGAQDNLIFTGGSFAVDVNGDLAALATFFKEKNLLINFQKENKNITGEIKDNNPKIDSIDMLYLSLVVSLRDYVNKNGFKKVVLGLSGGLDSAVSAAIAVDALGKDNVTAIMMPFKYTTDESILNAEILAGNLGIFLDTIPIHELYSIVEDKISSSFNRIETGVTTENMQARSRALILMTIANHTNSLVLNTGNKSEVAVGYFTLYGDGIGGFALLSDVFKTQVYQLADYRNKMNHVIPTSIVKRKPTAELSYGQHDQDLLPPYHLLDKIIQVYLEDKNIDDVIEKTGVSTIEAKRIINLINKNEFKRNQSPLGPQTSVLGFNAERHYPVTHNWEY